MWAVNGNRLIRPLDRYWIKKTPCPTICKGNRSCRCLFVCLFVCLYGEEVQDSSMKSIIQISWRASRDLISLSRDFLASTSGAQPVKDHPTLFFKWTPSLYVYSSIQSLLVLFRFSHQKLVKVRYLQQATNATTETRRDDLPGTTPVQTTRDNKRVAENLVNSYLILNWHDAGGQTDTTQSQ